MNIKIKDEKIYFKINNLELEKIHEGGSIKSCLQFPNNEKLQITLCTDNATSIELLQNQNIVTINCKVCEEQINTLKEIGKSKEGITLNYKNITAILQLDLKQNR